MSARTRRNTIVVIIINRLLVLYAWSFALDTFSRRYLQSLGLGRGNLSFHCSTGLWNWNYIVFLSNKTTFSMTLNLVWCWI